MPSTLSSCRWVFYILFACKNLECVSWNMKWWDGRSAGSEGRERTSGVENGVGLREVNVSGLERSGLMGKWSKSVTQKMKTLGPFFIIISTDWGPRPSLTHPKSPSLQLHLYSVLQHLSPKLMYYFDNLKLFVKIPFAWFSLCLFITTFFISICSQAELYF